MKLLGLWVVDATTPFMKYLVFAANFLAALMIVVAVPVLVWAVCASIEKMWNVVRGKDRLHPGDPWRWLRALPKRTKDGAEEWDAINKVAGVYDALFLDEPYRWTTEQERKEAEIFLRKRGYNIKNLPPTRV